MYRSKPPLTLPATSAICFPFGEKAAANTPVPGTDVFDCIVPWPQFDAWAEYGTVLVNASWPNTVPPWRVPSARIVFPSGDHASCPPRSQPGALVQLLLEANFV